MWTVIAPDEEHTDGPKIRMVHRKWWESHEIEPVSGPVPAEK
jgi:hypothetical protein